MYRIFFYIPNNFVHNMFSLSSAKRRASDKDLPATPFPQLKPWGILDHQFEQNSPSEPIKVNVDC